MKTLRNICLALVGAVAWPAVAQAEELEADLLVVGSKGTTGLRRAVYPSVSTHCVENASCPVLVYRERVDPADASPRSPTY